MDPDLLLLRAYANRADERAFETLTRRYVDLVYAAALRQVRDPHRAEDVTQAVFVLLARKARKLDDRVLLGGWLVNATRLVSSEFLRSERRRLKHEQGAAAMRRDMQSAAAEPKADQVGGVVDEAMSHLGETSRGVLVMQYLEGRSGREIAAALGISEDAARKRVSRALEELRKIFARQGMAMSSDSIVAGLALAKITAPAGLAAASAAAPAAKGAVALLAQGAAATMTYTAAKVAAAVAIAGAVVVGTGAGVAVLQQQNPPAAPAAAAAPAQVAKQPLPANIEGVVVNALGNPVPGARVMLSTARQRVNIYQPPTRGTPVAETDANGRYILPLRGELDSIVVSADEGFADVSWKALDEVPLRGDMTLKPWASVKGVLMEGNKPIPNATVRLWKVRDLENGWSSLYQHNTFAPTDAQGRFEFPQVMSGEVWLARGEASADWKQRGRVHYAQLNPGETRNVQVGGMGRPITGKIELEPAAAGKVKWVADDQHSVTCNIYGIIKGGENRPQWQKGDTREQFEAELEKWGRTREGAWKQRWRMALDGQLEPDGTFRFEDLEAGEYDIHFSTHELIKDVAFWQDVASGWIRIEVPEMPGGRSDEPLDVGVVKATLKPHLKPGDAAPALTLTTFGGGKWDLAEQKGKPVIVFLWSIRDEEDLKEFKRSIDALTADGKVAVIGMNMDQNPAAAKETAARLGINWPLAMAPDFDVVQRFDTAPTGAVVIDADGRIVQCHLHQARLLKRFVDRALIPKP